MHGISKLFLGPFEHQITWLCSSFGPCIGLSEPDISLQWITVLFFLHRLEGLVLNTALASAMVCRECPERFYWLGSYKYVKGSEELGQWQQTRPCSAPAMLSSLLFTCAMVWSDIGWLDYWTDFTGVPYRLEQEPLLSWPTFKEFLYQFSLGLQNSVFFSFLLS